MYFLASTCYYVGYDDGAYGKCERGAHRIP